MSESVWDLYNGDPGPGQVDLALKDEILLCETAPERDPDQEIGAGRLRYEEGPRAHPVDRGRPGGLRSEPVRLRGSA